MRIPAILDKRRAPRASATYSATIRDTSGRVLGHGRTSNVGIMGLLLIAPLEHRPHLNDHLLIEIDLNSRPYPGGPKVPQAAHYLARVVRTRRVGRLVGVGLELLDKIN